MSSTTGQDGPATTRERVPEQIEERLRAQRQALAASVDELAARVDPRTQARQTSQQLRGRAEARIAVLRQRAEAYGVSTEMAAALGAAAVASLLAAVLTASRLARR
ncbi:DUF3618 domain-containing protein [Actinomyces sp. 2119]|uniref:DUF3618 domain-containing protein n=1 Tax=Actinomyces sp. 2119 TaxID=2321393 RepID=UPI000E6D1837|nr:DUF3618 domain-containing protein [Actinomyces sp. 2119]RJF41919.1 DUF3618 domain-containing protein [Actinomyces sp. 2119]